MNFKDPEGQTARWLKVMSTYTFEIQHRAGIKHGNADGLSRQPCDDCEQCNRGENNLTQRTSNIKHSMRTPCTDSDKAIEVDEKFTECMKEAETEVITIILCCDSNHWG